MLKLKKGNLPDKLFDKRQLRMGIKVEMEYTNSKVIAKMIAKGHLAGEDPKYYTKLKKAGL